MNRYRKTYRLLSLVLLFCFLTTLSGVSAGAGHDCCGNCAEPALQHSMPTEAVMASSDCCATRPACTCTFESTDNRGIPPHGIVYVNIPGDNPSAGLVATVSGPFPAGNNKRLPYLFRLSEDRPRPGPIYLTNQSFLC
ncbi:MAG: hypothetical protein GY697_11445 [Desulfobacterales bacterium]|nr:hypothetical protein [Desulfobacterales bacterium]